MPCFPSVEPPHELTACVCGPQVALPAGMTLDQWGERLAETFRLQVSE